MPLTHTIEGVRPATPARLPTTPRLPPDSPSGRRIAPEVRNIIVLHPLATEAVYGPCMGWL